MCAFLIDAILSRNVVGRTIKSLRLHERPAENNALAMATVEHCLHCFYLECTKKETRASLASFTRDTFYHYYSDAAGNVM